ncbi:hypothetical protein D3C78_1075370 [compost metagenome]
MHQDFGAVLVVPGRQGAGHIVLAVDAEAKAKAVTGCLVLIGVGLQVVPELFGQGVPLRDRGRVTFGEGGFGLLVAIFRVQDVAQYRRFFGENQLVEVERHVLAEAHDEDAFAVLGHPVLRVDNPVVDVITQLVPQGFHDGLEGAALVVPLQVLHVLQQESSRAVVRDDTGHVEEQGALRLVLEAVGAAQRVLLGHAGNRERLAGEAGHQHVVLGDLAGLDLGDVAGHVVVAVEVRLIGHAGVLVPLAGEHTAATGALECFAHTTNAGEQVDEAEGRVCLVGMGAVRSGDTLIDHFERELFGWNLPFLPTVDGAFRFSGQLHHVFDAHAGFFAQRCKAGKGLVGGHLSVFLWERFSHFAHSGH